ncbi:hypothetical protein HPE56_19375 [Maribacter sp. ANRC-HE7]|uniref:Uncharacterized protein n=1 Tax=Maribacter aquimaris TaxID=2737171 RepID=A0ABR7V6F9_9FLAO|nr:hypothetical protein [Maribacter aquimaris]MBD0779965.1 hypothetical protein [Maribacter aquimaris]
MNDLEASFMKNTHIMSKLSCLITLFGILGFQLVNSQQSDNIQNNEFQYNNKTYPVSEGLEEVFKKRNNRSGSQLNISDGKFYQTQIWISGNINYIWRPKNASIWLYAKLYAQGSEGLTSGTYTIKPNNTDTVKPITSDLPFFLKGKCAIDINNNGKLDKGTEFFKVIDGTITLNVVSKGYSVEFELKLSNGKIIKGKFKKDFTQV